MHQVIFVNFREVLFSQIGSKFFAKINHLKVYTLKVQISLGTDLVNLRREPRESILAKL